MNAYVFQVGRSGGRTVRVEAVSKYAAKQEVDKLLGITPKTARKLLKIVTLPKQS